MDEYSWIRLIHSFFGSIQIYLKYLTGQIDVWNIISFDKKVYSWSTYGCPLFIQLN